MFVSALMKDVNGLKETLECTKTPYVGEYVVVIAGKKNVQHTLSKNIS